MPGDRGQVRYGFEREEGVPGQEFQYVPFVSETIMAEREYKVNPNLDPTGSEPEGEVLKAEGKGKLVCAANSESLLRMRIHQHGWYTQSAPAAGVHLYELRDFNELEDDPITHYVDSLHFGIWRDEQTLPSEYRAFGAKVSQFECRVDANDFVFFDHDLLFLRDRYMKTPDEVAVNAAYTGYVEVRGMRAGGDENGNEYDVKVITGGALDGIDEPTIQFGKNGVFPGVGIATVPLIPNVWINVLNSDESVAGSDREPIQIRFIANEAVDVVTADDHWAIEAIAPKPVAVFSARPNLNAAQCEVRFSRDGGTTWTTRRIEGGFSLKMGVPREAKPGLGSIYMQSIGRPQQARRWWELSFNGTYENRELIQAMISGASYQAYMRFDGGLIGSTGLRDFSEFTLVKSRVTKAGATVTSPGDLPENPTFRGFTSGGSTLCIERHQNTIANVIPFYDVS